MGRSTDHIGDFLRTAFVEVTSVPDSGLDGVVLIFNLIGLVSEADAHKHRVYALTKELPTLDANSEAWYQATLAAKVEAGLAEIRRRDWNDAELMLRGLMEVAARSDDGSVIVSDLDFLPGLSEHAKVALVSAWPILRSIQRLLSGEISSHDADEVITEAGGAIVLAQWSNLGKCLLELVLRDLTWSSGRKDRLELAGLQVGDVLEAVAVRLGMRNSPFGSTALLSRPTGRQTQLSGWLQRVLSLRVEDALLELSHE